MRKEETKMTRNELLRRRSVLLTKIAIAEYFMEDPDTMEEDVPYYQSKIAKMTRSLDEIDLTLNEV
jgi:hypothetical protein